MLTNLYPGWMLLAFGWLCFLACGQSCIRGGLSQRIAFLAAHSLLYFLELFAVFVWAFVLTHLGGGR